MFFLDADGALDYLSIPRLAGALTAFVQGIGFIVTAIVPYVAEFLREWTGSLEVVWVMLLLVTVKFDPKRYTQIMKV